MSLVGNSGTLNKLKPFAALSSNSGPIRAGRGLTRKALGRLIRNPRAAVARAGHQFLVVTASNESVGATREQDAEIIPKTQELTEDYQKAFEDGITFGRKNILPKFLQPRIDDPGLLPSDALVSINGAILVAIAARLGYIPMPTWLQPLLLPGQEAIPSILYILPAIFHGVNLAACWVLGALAAGAYESEAYMGTLGEAITRTWKAGLFAVGVLVLATQLSTSLAAQGLAPTDPATMYDKLILRAYFDVFIDVFVQAFALTAFRTFRWADAQQGRKPW